METGGWPGGGGPLHAPPYRRVALEKQHAKGDAAMKKSLPTAARSVRRRATRRARGRVNGAQNLASSRAPKRGSSAIRREETTEHHPSIHATIL